MRPSTRTPIRAALLGRNAITREGLRHVLTEHRIAITRSVADPADLPADLGDDLDSDILIVIDAASPGDDEGDDGCDEVDGAEELRLLHRRFPSVKLVVLTGRFGFAAMADAFRAGAHGYLVREMACGPLVASLGLVALGEKVMPSALINALARDGSYDRPQDWPGHDHAQARDLIAAANLTRREREILDCLITGCPNKVISNRLSIAEATVKVHVKAILRKLCVRNRTQAAIRGVIGGLDHRLDVSPMADMALVLHPVLA